MTWQKLGKQTFRHGPITEPTFFNLPPGVKDFNIYDTSSTVSRKYPFLNDEDGKLLRVAINGVSPDRPFEPYVPVVPLPSVSLGVDIDPNDASVGTLISGIMRKYRTSSELYVPNTSFDGIDVWDLSTIERTEQRTLPNPLDNIYGFDTFNDNAYLIGRANTTDELLTYYTYDHINNTVSGGNLNIDYEGNTFLVRIYRGYGSLLGVPERMHTTGSNAQATTYLIGNQYIYFNIAFPNEATTIDGVKFTTQVHLARWDGNFNNQAEIITESQFPFAPWTEGGNTFTPQGNHVGFGGELEVSGQSQIFNTDKVLFASDISTYPTTGTGLFFITGYWDETNNETRAFDNGVGRKNTVQGSIPVAAQNDNHVCYSVNGTDVYIVDKSDLSEVRVDFTFTKEDVRFNVSPVPLQENFIIFQRVNNPTETSQIGVYVRPDGSIIRNILFGEETGVSQFAGAGEVFFGTNDTILNTSSGLETFNKDIPPATFDIVNGTGYLEWIQ